MSDPIGAAPTIPEQIELIEARFPGRAIRDTAVTHALLRQVAAGQRAAALRLYRPDDVVVFSLLDARRPGFPAALEAARDAGCGAVLRLGGGHAALFHQRSLAFSLAVPDGQARDGIRRRFDAVSGLIARALGRLGVDARVGEVAGEYCPGEHSVNARGARKLMGVGQRVIRGGAHVGGVIVVQDAERVREVLRPAPSTSSGRPTPPAASPTRWPVSGSRPFGTRSSMSSAGPIGSRRVPRTTRHSRWPKSWTRGIGPAPHRAPTIERKPPHPAQPRPRRSTPTSGCARLRRGAAR
jgi:lipoate-protein ligase A